MRKLLNGKEVESFEYPIDLIIHTKAPAKWKIIDMETGQEYIGSDIAHETFAEILRSKVSNGKVGSWSKIKGRDSEICNYCFDESKYMDVVEVKRDKYGVVGLCQKHYAFTHEVS